MKPLFIFPLILCSILAFWQQPATAEETAAKTKTMMVLDASGSMWGQVDGKNKVVIAREVIAGLAKSWKKEDHLGLMTYGHRSKGDCNDIETLIPVSAIDSGQFIKTVDGINPKGKTPLTESVRKAAEQLKYEEDPVTVILVTDGLETCNADPCAVSKELENSGVHFTAHVVAFDLTEEERKTLKCIADNTGGKFLSADNANQLQSALSEVAKEAAIEPPGVRLHTVMKEGGKPITKDFLYYYVYDAAGKEVAGTNENEPLIHLPAGEYKVKVRHNITYVEDSFTVPENGKVDHTIVIGTGHLKVSAKETADGPILTKGPIYHVYAIKEDGEPTEKSVEFNNNPTHSFALARGKYRVKASMDDTIRVLVDAEVKADETTELVITLNSGSLSVSSTLEGKPATGTYWYIYNIGEDGNAAGSSIDFNNNAEVTFQLPAGDYSLRASNSGLNINKYQKVTVTAGKTKTVSVALDEE